MLQVTLVTSPIFAILMTYRFEQFCWVLHKSTSWEWKGV